MSDEIVKKLLDDASNIGIVGSSMETLVLAANKLSHTALSSGMTPLEVLNGCAATHALAHVVGALGSETQAPTPGASKQQYLDICASIYDILTIYQRSLNNAAQQRKT